MILALVTYTQSSQMPLSLALFPSGLDPEIEGRIPGSVIEFQADSFEPGSPRPLLLFSHGLATPEPSHPDPKGTCGRQSRVVSSLLTAAGSHIHPLFQGRRGTNMEVREGQVPA